MNARSYLLISATALLLLALALVLNSRDPRPPSPTMSTTSDEMTPVPGKPGWLRSPVIDDNLHGDHEKIFKAAECVAQSYDSRSNHVFSGLMPDDDAQVPAGWEDAQRAKLVAESAKYPVPVLPSVLESVTFDYQPYRVFVAPLEDTADVIRLFRVGSHSHPDDAYLESVVKKVFAISRVAPFTIPELSPAHVRLVFLDPISMETARVIAALFPFMTVTEEDGFDDAFIGMEGYLSEGEADPGHDFLAERFFRDQEIRLWWD